HAVQPERPTVATHAGTVSPGWFEIETGVERDQYAPARTGASTPTVLKFGIADNVQLSVFGGLSKPPKQSFAVGDAAVGIKWRLIDDAPVVGDFALLPSLKLPTGSSTTGAGTGTTDASLLFISSHDFASTSMDINVGYTHRSGDGNHAPVNATLWTVSFGGALFGAVGYAAECYGYPATSGPAGQRSIVALLGGPTFQIASWLVFDTGIIIPLTGPQPHALYAGAVYNVGQLWGPRR
ncbi:MAG TPA: hypothetical protein VHV78_07455, partial [Gemmatimonadaceae bacterium]|nr:hypothetical protein [Gemmatimonadaceae bacterium]